MESLYRAPIGDSLGFDLIIKNRLDTVGERLGADGCVLVRIGRRLAMIGTGSRSINLAVPQMMVER